MGQLGHTMLLVCGFALYGCLQAYWGEQAGDILGYPYFWIAAFLFMPGVSHLFFLYLYYNKMERARVMKVINDIFRPRIRHLDGQKPVEGPVSVTPFEGPVVVEEADQTIRPLILEKCQDEEIEHLIQWQEWSKAYSIAIERFELAKVDNLQGKMAMYDAYRQLIAPQILQFIRPE
jgi:hypothetical protein